MYNPYLEEQSFSPLPAQGEATQAPQPSPAEGKLPSLSSLMQWKDSLGQLGDLSMLTQLLPKKKSASKPQQKQNLPAELQEGLSEGFLSQMKQKLRLDQLEGGDILLVLILIYLMIEGDDKVELAITLGILAFLWYIEGKDSPESETN